MDQWPFNQTALAAHVSQKPDQVHLYRRYCSAHPDRHWVGETLFGGVVAAVDSQSGTLVVADDERRDGRLVNAAHVGQVKRYAVGQAGRVWQDGQQLWVTPLAIDFNRSTVFFDPTSQPAAHQSPGVLKARPSGAAKEPAQAAEDPVSAPGIEDYLHDNARLVATLAGCRAELSAERREKANLAGRVAELELWTSASSDLAAQLGRLEEELEQEKARAAGLELQLADAEMRLAEQDCRTAAEEGQRIEEEAAREADAENRKTGLREELERHKGMVREGLWKLPIQNERLDGLEVVEQIEGQKVVSRYGPDQACESVQRASRRVDTSEFEAKLEAVGNTTDLVVLLLTEHRQELAGLRDVFLARIEEMKEELDHVEAEAHAAEERVQELHRVLGPKWAIAVKFVRKRINVWRLRRRLRGLMSAGPGLRKRISKMKTSQGVMAEMVHVSDKLDSDLNILADDFLTPVRQRFLVRSVGSKADPNGWLLHEFDIFLRAVVSLHREHGQILPRLKATLDTAADRIAAISVFYIDLSKTVLKPLVQYMNRLGSVMKLLKDLGAVEDSAGTKLKDFLFEVERRLGEENPVDFYLFGVLQTVTNWASLLKRLKKNTMESHVSMGRLDTSYQAVLTMNQRADDACKAYRQIKQVQESLYQPAEYLVVEGTRLLREGDALTVRSASANVVNASEIKKRVWDPCHLILLSDALLMCEAVKVQIPASRRRRSKNITKFMVRRLVRRPVASEMCTVKLFLDKFFMVECQGLYLFEAPSEAERDEWVQSFKESWHAPMIRLQPILEASKAAHEIEESLALPLALSRRSTC